MPKPQLVYVLEKSGLNQLLAAQNMRIALTVSVNGFGLMNAINYAI